MVATKEISVFQLLVHIAFTAHGQVIGVAIDGGIPHVFFISSDSRGMALSLRPCQQNQRAFGQLMLAAG